MFANLFRQAPGLYCNYFFLPLYSSETVNLARPFARRAANTRRPFFVAILSRKPCLFFLFLLEGWNVLFIVLYILYCLFCLFRLFAFQLAKLLFFFILAKFLRGIFLIFILLRFAVLEAENRKVKCESLELKLCTFNLKLVKTSLEFPLRSGQNNVTVWNISFWRNCNIVSKNFYI